MLACAATIVLTASLAAGEWAQWRGPGRSGKSADTDLLSEWPEDGPPKLWSVSGLGSGYASPALTEETIYITGVERQQVKLTALTLDGQTKWSRTICPAFTGDHGSNTRSTIAVDGDRLYFLSGNGAILCLKAENGEEVWQRQMSEFGGSVPRWGYSESVLVHGDLAIVTPGGSRFMVGLDKNTGETVWETRGFNDAAHYTSAIAVEQDGVEMVIQGSRGSLIGVSPENGALLWQINWPGRNTANCPTPAYEDGYVFWAVGYNQGGIGVKLTVEDGNVSAEQVYHTTDMICHHGGYVIVDGYVYGNHARGWACLDLKTGESQWYERGVGKGSIAYADGMLYTFSERGAESGLVEARPDAFNEKGRVSVEGEGRFSWAHPVVANGRLFLRYGSQLHCFDVRNPEAGE